MTTIPAIREQKRSRRLRQLREGAASVLGTSPGARVLLFGSLARGDWDGLSDGDLPALAPTQVQASGLADALLLDPP